MTPNPSIEAKRQRVRTTVLAHWNAFPFQGILMMILGMLAVTVPNISYLIWSGWPNTAKWVVGLYVGIDLFFFGLPMIMMAFAARNVDSSRTAG